MTGTVSDAVLAAPAHVAEGRRFVADLDLEKFFDRMNHDVPMARVARRIVDGPVLWQIRRYIHVRMRHVGEYVMASIMLEPLFRRHC